MLAGTLLALLHCNRAGRISPAIPSSPSSRYLRIEQQFIAGNLAQAEAASRQAELEMEGKTDPVWVTRFRLQHARIQLYQGHSVDALALLLSPLPAENAEPSLPCTRSSLLALAYDRTGDPAHARQALAQANRQCADQHARAGFYLAAGIIDGEDGRLADAERAFQASLTGATQTKDRFLQMQALMNLGVGALQQEHYDAALERFRQAARLATEIGANVALEKATGNVGSAFYRLGDYRRALANSQLAEQQAAALGASLDQVTWLNNAGLSQFRLGDLAAAKSSYEQSSQLARSLQNKEEIGDSLVALAYLSLATDDLPGALDRARQAQHLAEERGAPDDSIEPILIQALALARQGPRSSEKSLLLALEHRSANTPSLRWEIENALANLFSNAGDDRTADAWFRRAIATFRLQRSSLSTIDSRLPFLENGSSLYLGYMEQLIREGNPDAALRVLDQSRAETLADGLGVRPVSRAGGEIAHPQKLARRLGGTILVYCLRPQTSYLWAISPGRSSFLRLPGSEAILPLVAAHTHAILSSKDVLAQPDAPGLALYRDLVEPAASLLAPHSKVYLLADEALSALNFETLLVPGTQPHFWIDDADILNAHSISLLAASQVQRSRKPSPGQLLLVGDPVYDRPNEVKLAHAADEVARVAVHFPPERRLVLTGAAATPAAYQGGHPQDYAYIHFVAHATASEIDPLDSSVLLSAVPGEFGASKLYARSILARRLNADLVTISSCFGSGVRSYSGEGLIGLAWAFLHSGAHHVIGALWEVSDASTPLLMSAMYDSLSAGSRPDVALRSAKLAMLHGAGVFRKPFYWAAFQLYVGA